VWERLCSTLSISNVVEMEDGMIAVVVPCLLLLLLLLLLTVVMASRIARGLELAALECIKTSCNNCEQ
jgi:hypothetical protein